MPTEPTAPEPIPGMDAQTAQTTAFELMAVTRAMFGLVDPTQEQVPDITGRPDEQQPTQSMHAVPVPQAVEVPRPPTGQPASLPVPPVAAPVPHTGIPLPEAAPSPEHSEPQAAPPIASPATPSVQAPAALPLPDAIPVVDQDQDHRARPGRRSLDLLQEIAFLDE